MTRTDACRIDRLAPGDTARLADLNSPSDEACEDMDACAAPRPDADDHGVFAPVAAERGTGAIIVVDDGSARKVRNARLCPSHAS